MLERLRRDQDDARYLTRREHLVAAAVRAPLMLAWLVFPLWQLVDPEVPVWWALVATAIWVLLAAWPVAAVSVRHRERIRRRRRAESRTPDQQGARTALHES